MATNKDKVVVIFEVKSKEESIEDYLTLFDNYHITVAAVVREYTDSDRTESPKDSNSYLL